MPSPRASTRPALPVDRGGPRRPPRPASMETLQRNRAVHRSPEPAGRRRPRARDRDSGAVVELLTPNEGPDRDEPVELPALGAWLQPLRFLDYLIHAADRGRDPLSLRSPVERALSRRATRCSKLILAIRRSPSAAAKARKDVEQAAALIRVLCRGPSGRAGRGLHRSARPRAGLAEQPREGRRPPAPRRPAGARGGVDPRALRPDWATSASSHLRRASGSAKAIT